MKYLLPLLLFFSFYGHAADFKLELVLSQASSSEASTTDSDLTIVENLHNGKVLKLSNGTLWEVAPQDVEITEIWIFPFPLKLEKSGNKQYPFYLVNLHSKTKILVRHIGPTEVPQGQSPSQESPEQPQEPEQPQAGKPPAPAKPNQQVAPPPPPTSLEN